MNNILFFLTPKAMCAYVYDDYTLRQALEKMESAGFAALPILNRRGEYRGTLTEGDLLWGLKNMCYMDMRQAESRRIMEISRRKDNIPVRVTTPMKIRTHSLVSSPVGRSSNTVWNSCSTDVHQKRVCCQQQTLLLFVIGYGSYKLRTYSISASKLP